MIIYFCNLCKEKPISKTLDVLDLFSAAQDQENEFPANIPRDNQNFDEDRVSYDGLHSVLQIFRYLKVAQLKNTDITLAKKNRTEVRKFTSQLKTLSFTD